MDSSEARMIVVYFDDGTFGPKDNKESKLRTFFEDVNLTNGGEIEKMNLNRNNSNQAFIYYKEKEVAERVAKQGNIQIAVYKFKVKLNKKIMNQSEENKIRDPYEEFNDDGEKATAAAPKKQPPIYKPSSDLYRRPIIIDGNNVGMRLLTICISMYRKIDIYNIS